MFTQCSKCETIFKISAEVLRSAGGQVRCGRCGEVFDALARLAEQPTQFTVGESPLELETRADHILQSKSAPRAPAHDEFEPAESPDVEVARLEIQDGLDFDLSGDDPALEFTLPPGELDRIFVDPKVDRTTALPERVEDARAAAAHEAERAASIDAEVLAASSSALRVMAQSGAGGLPDVASQVDTGVTGHGDEIPRTRAGVHPHDTAYGNATAHGDAAPHADAAAYPDGAPHADAAAHVDATAYRDATPHADATPYRDAAPRAGATPYEDAMPHGDDTQYRETTQYQDATTYGDAMPHRGAATHGDAQALRAAIVRGPAPDSPREWRAIWIVLGAMLVIMLALQLVHQNRAWLAANSALAGPLRFVYEKFGAPIPIALNLSAYQLRQFGVTGDPDANGALRVRASILNSAGDFEPYPLLRVTLADRFGNRIGGRDFEPAEYLGKPVARLLSPGERVDATLNILDPGKDAEGFEIDVCLRGPDRAISCANDAAQRPK